MLRGLVITCLDVSLNHYLKVLCVHGNVGREWIISNNGGEIVKQGGNPLHQHYHKLNRKTRPYSSKLRIILRWGCIIPPREVIKIDGYLWIVHYPRDFHPVRDIHQSQMGRKERALVPIHHLLEVIHCHTPKIMIVQYYSVTYRDLQKLPRRSM